MTIQNKNGSQSQIEFSVFVLKKSQMGTKIENFILKIVRNFLI
jgi:hypothetical protein